MIVCEHDWEQEFVCDRHVCRRCGAAIDGVVSAAPRLWCNRDRAGYVITPLVYKSPWRRARQGSFYAEICKLGQRDSRGLPLYELNPYVRSV